jgi:hypothetical protein
MSSTTSWVVLAYEVTMYFHMRAAHGNPAAVAAMIKGEPGTAGAASDAAVISAATLLLSSTFIGNAIAESAVLHARILCDLFSSEDKSHPDDVGFSDLFDDWETDERYTNLKSQVAQMKSAYGDSTTENSPCRQFNKMLAHLTKERGLEHNYEGALQTVDPFIQSIVSELGRLKPGFPNNLNPLP